MQRPLIDSIITVSIEKLALGGAGIARHENLVIFIPFTCPGDHLKIRLTQIKKNYAEGEIVEILTPSPHRIIPKCPVFGKCGGCAWQHVDYNEQLVQKQEIIDGLLRKSLSKLNLDQSWQVEKVIPSPSEWNYRNRITIKKSNSQIGFFERKSHNIIDIDECPIAEPIVNAGLKNFKENSKKSSTNTQNIENFRIQVLENEKFDIKNVDEDADPAAFSQVNRFQNKNLQNFIHNLFKDTYSKNPSEKFELLDLYGGNGNLSLPLYSQFDNLEIYSVELNKEASQEGLKKSKTITSKSKIEFFNASVETFLKRFSFRRNHNFVLLDPPRSGCDEKVISALSALQPQTLIYISCNPATLTRDLNLFLSKSNSNPNKCTYRIQKVQPFDMFPQTDHVETLVFLERQIN